LKRKALYQFLLENAPSFEPYMLKEFIEVVPIILWEFGSMMEPEEDIISRSISFLKLSLITGERYDVENRMIPFFSIFMKKKSKRVYGTFHKLQEKYQLDSLSLLQYFSSIPEALLTSVAHSLVRENNSVLFYHALEIMVGRLIDRVVSVDSFLQFTFSCMMTLPSSSISDENNWFDSKNLIIKRGLEVVNNLFSSQEIARLLNVAFHANMNPVVSWTLPENR
jgi:hypothetical protein